MILRLSRRSMNGAKPGNLTNSKVSKACPGWPYSLSIMAGLCLASPAHPQVGPNNPSVSFNNTGTGSNAWSTTNNIFASDDGHATVATKGLSNYVVGEDFEFNLGSPANILGIQLGVEKSTLNPQSVALLDNWSTGLTKIISAGTDRCLIVVAAIENGATAPADITAMTYGGRSMTQAMEMVVGGGSIFSGRLEVWMLLEAEIVMAASTTIVPTYNSYTPLEYCEAFSAAVFSNVDQLAPLLSSQTNGIVGTTNPYQLGAAIATLDGSMAVNAVLCGNNTSPASTDGGTNTYTINSGYTEGTDLYFANTIVSPNTGACLQTAHKAIATAGTEQPSCTFAGTVNRHVMVGFTLQRARELDYDVRLVKAGVIGGTNLADPAPWTTTDGYTIYGGPTSLWGQSLTVADINAPDFGAAFSARVQNGTARIDHMHLTIYWQSTLPIELLDFRAVQQGRIVRLDWITASEINNDHFIVERSRDGLVFEEVDQIAGAGTSHTTLFYHAIDEHPFTGTSYYRLKQVDIDGTTAYSPVVVVAIAHGDLVVFPNPSADGSFTVYDIALERDQVAVYTSNMRLVRTHLGAGTDPVIHLEDLPDGTYVLMVRSGDTIRTARVVKASSMR